MPAAESRTMPRRIARLLRWSEACGVHWGFAEASPAREGRALRWSGELSCGYAREALDRVGRSSPNVTFVRVATYPKDVDGRTSSPFPSGGRRHREKLSIPRHTSLREIPTLRRARVMRGWIPGECIRGRFVRRRDRDQSRPSNRLVRRRRGRQPGGCTDLTRPRHSADAAATSRSKSPPPRWADGSLRLALLI